jgi:hypothetical protein
MVLISLRRAARALLCLAGVAAATALQAAAPDISGTWLPVDSLSTAWPDPLPLTDAGRQRHGAFDPDRNEPAGYCMPLGTPRNTLAGVSPLEVLQKSDRVYFIFQPNLLNAETRRVLIGAPAPDADPDRLPTWMGISRGRWDGQSLVVETTEMEPQSILNADGLSQGGKLRMTERWHVEQHQTRGKLLVDEIVLEDADTFRTPVRLRRVFAWAPDAQFAEGQCSERLWIDQIWRNRLKEHAAQRRAQEGAQ